jgi:hypothetical protein
MGEQYTPGHSANATAFMAARSFGSHGEFIKRYLTPGMKVLDCGCVVRARFQSDSQMQSDRPVM